MLKIAIIKCQGKISSVYISPQLKGEIEVDIIDYDNLDELSEQNKITEIQIQEKILVENANP